MARFHRGVRRWRRWRSELFKLGKERGQYVRDLVVSCLKCEQSADQSIHHFVARKVTARAATVVYDEIFAVDF